MSATITVDGTIDRDADQSGNQRRQSEPAIAIETHDNGPSDADVIREARQALERTTAQLTTAQSQAATARNEAAQARDQAARVTQSRVADHRAILAQTVETADAELARAKTALQSAGESGDWAGIAAAQEAIGSATYRKTHAAGQLAALGDGMATQPPARQQQNGGQTREWIPGPRARQWLADHPRMENDQEYRAIASMAHAQTEQLRLAPESDEYFDHINRAMAAAFPEDGGGRANGGQTMPANRDQGNGSGGYSSSAGPSNRGGGGGTQGGFKMVRTGLGPVNVSEANGRMRINIPDQSVRDNMEEGAKICFPNEWSKDPAAALAKYVGDQVAIAREIEAGGDAGLLPMGEGRTYR